MPIDFEDQIENIFLHFFFNLISLNGCNNRNSWSIYENMLLCILGLFWPSKVETTDFVSSSSSVSYMFWIVMVPNFLLTSFDFSCKRM